MIQRIQSLFWLIVIVLIVIYSFQVYDVENDFRNYQQPVFSTLSGLSIIALLLSIFSFHRRKRQLLFSNLSLLLLMVQMGIQIYHHNSHDIMQYVETFVLLVLAWGSNLLGTIAMKRDIQLLENSSRLR